MRVESGQETGKIKRKISNINDKTNNSTVSLYTEIKRNKNKTSLYQRKV